MISSSVQKKFPIQSRAVPLKSSKAADGSLAATMWLKAKAELLHPIHLDIAESDEAVTVRADVPGFSAKDLDIRLEPRRLAITGERETKEERKTEKKLYSERCVDQVFRAIDLPAEVNPEKATATLKDGILQLAMPKTAAARNIKAEAKAV